MSAQSEARAAGWTQFGNADWGRWWFHPDLGTVAHREDGWHATNHARSGAILGPYTTMRAAMRALETETQP